MAKLINPEIYNVRTYVCMGTQNIRTYVCTYISNNYLYLLHVCATIESHKVVLYQLLDRQSKTADYWVTL